MHVGRVEDVFDCAFGVYGSGRGRRFGEWLFTFGLACLTYAGASD